MAVKTKQAVRLKRRRRVRAKITGTAQRPRISVFRSNRGISAQLVDDVAATRSQPSAGPRRRCVRSRAWSRPP
ncbi:MAG: hypothetical protein H0T43_11410, partial [Solirubrobacterales bacterium]|nr:hypothetical protein [Solirubrobacterales bacterium]